jgi:hypothetical protein
MGSFSWISFDSRENVSTPLRIRSNCQNGNVDSTLVYCLSKLNNWHILCRYFLPAITFFINVLFLSFEG